MMKQILIITTDDGKEYPCRVTLGAMRRYKAVTGKEADSIEGVSDMSTFLWCCCVSDCKADGKEFKWDVDEFCDHVDVSALTAFSKGLEKEKKTKK